MKNNKKFIPFIIKEGTWDEETDYDFDGIYDNFDAAKAAVNKFSTEFYENDVMTCYFGSFWGWVLEFEDGKFVDRHFICNG